MADGKGRSPTALRGWPTRSRLPLPRHLGRHTSRPAGYRAHPDADLAPPEGGDVVSVTGHYEDPAATSCRASVDPVFADEGDVALPDPAQVVLTCRATFVWTDYEVTGHQELSP